MSQNVTQKTVLDLLSSAMFQKPLSVNYEVDWKFVFDECKAQSMISISFSNIRKNEMLRCVQ